MTKNKVSINVIDISTSSFRGFILDVDYQRIRIGNDLQAEMVLHLRDDNGKRSELRSTGFKPYIYADLNEKELQVILDEEKEFRDWILDFQKKTKFLGGCTS